MEEKLYEPFIDELKRTDTPAATLSKFYWRLFEIPPDKKTITMISKLLRLYGRDVVFMSLLDLYDVDKVDLNNPYPLLVYFCKKRVISAFDKITESVDLTPRLEKLKKRFANNG